MVIKTIFLIISILIANSNKKPDLQLLAQSIRDHSALRHGMWSIYVKNLTKGKILVDMNSNKSMIPASNLKLLISAVAMDQLGEHFTLQTTLGHTGTISSDGTLSGHIVLKGRGDPTLGSPTLETVPSMDSLLTLFVEAIQSKGILQINGDVIADDSYLDYMPLPGAWSWSDIGNYYAAGTSALTFHENLYYLYFKPSWYVGGPAEIIRVEPAIPDLKFINHMRTGPVGSGDKGYIYGAPWQYLHQLEGTIPAGVTEFSIKGSLPDPAQFAVQCLKKALIQSGIKITGNAKTVRESTLSVFNSQIIFTLDSPFLKEIIYHLNKTSVNLYAEQLLKITAKEISNSGDNDTGFELIDAWLEKKNIISNGLFMHDASGLSYSNRVTTCFMVDFLEKMTRENFFESLYASLPVAGDPNDSGTLSSMCRGTRAAKNLRAKTGSLPRVRAHSGYVKSISGDMIAFSMIANDYNGSSGAINRLHEKVMVKLANTP